MSPITVVWPEGALPVSVVITILCIGGALLGYALVQLKIFGITKFFKYVSEMPGQKLTVLVGLIALMFWVSLAGAMAMLGMDFPDGYGDIAWLIAGALGFGAAAGVGKHAFSAEREAARGEAAARVAAATPAQPTQVLAASGSKVSVNTQAEQSGAAPDDGAVG